jgi:cation transport regulator ChaB
VDNVDGRGNDSSMARARHVANRADDAKYKVTDDGDMKAREI